MRRALAVLSVVSVALVVGMLPAGAQSRSGAKPDAEQRSFADFADFNGDSFTDLAVGAPGENVGSTVDAGAVNVFYGTASGLSSTSQVLLQGNPEAGDHFGTAITVGFFNGDSFADLAVGAPDENVGAIVDAGAASVFLGSAGGLSATSQTLVQDNPEAGDRFGAALAAETVSADAFTELAVGAPGENVGSTVDAGAVNVFYDTTGVLPASGSQVLLQDNPEAGDQLGAAVLANFVNPGGFADLVVGAPGENVGATVDAGAANLFASTTPVLPTRSTQTLLQDNVEAGDRFGAALTMGPFGNFFDDLVVGAPGENVGGIVDAGAANFFPNPAGTLPSTSTQTFLQDNPETGDQFGAALVAGQFTSDFAELVGGAPGENVGATVDAGAANLFANPAGTLPSTSTQTLLQDNPEPGDHFGAALTGVFFFPFLDLVVGAPGENVGSTVDAGTANVFNHSTRPLPGTSNQTLLQAGVEPGDHFGAALDV